MAVTPLTNNPYFDRTATSQLPVGIQAFGRYLATIQRQSTDYDPWPHFSRVQVIGLVSETEDVLGWFETASAAQRRAPTSHDPLWPGRA